MTFGSQPAMKAAGGTIRMQNNLPDSRPEDNRSGLKLILLGLGLMVLGACVYWFGR
jgi:hypothetical protein